MDQDEARWSVLDPTARPFDLERLRAQIEPLVQEAARAERVNHGVLLGQIEGLLFTEHGAWVEGWVWRDADRVPAFPHDRREARETADRVLAAVASWRGYLEQLAARFAELRAEADALPLEAVVERAAARLLPIVLARTGADDAWYFAFAFALDWFLEDLLGEDASEPLRGIAYDVASGRFSSWIAPDEATAREACAEIGAAVAGAAAPRDAIADWLRIRPGAFGNLAGAGAGAPRRDPVLADGHERFIEEIDRPRDPVRADRMEAALVLCRDSARRGMPLTFDQLAEWQGVVLGGSAPAAFRTGPAYAKGGREHYALGPDTQRRFEDALADAHGPPDHAVARAARVYLDVCFFHPFDDGNARAARLALDHVLTSAGLALHAADPLFVVSRAAADIEGLRAFVGVLAQLVGPRAC